MTDKIAYCIDAQAKKIRLDSFHDKITPLHRNLKRKNDTITSLRDRIRLYCNKNLKNVYNPRQRRFLGCFNSTRSEKFVNTDINSHVQVFLRISK